MRIIVLGADGFIGRAVVEQVRQAGLHPKLLTFSGNSDAGEFIDLRSRQQVISNIKDADVVFHLGGMLGTSELNTMCYEATITNIAGTLNVLDACIVNDIPRLVYPAKPDIWFNAYSITKRTSLDFVSLYKRRTGLDVRAIVLRNVYGPGQATAPIRKVVPDMVMRALRNEPIEIFGSGNQPVDLIYVDDVAEILCRVGLSNHFDTPHVPVEFGRTTRLSVNQLAELVQKVLNVRCGVTYLPMREGEAETELLPPVVPPTAVEVLNLSKLPMDPEEGLRRCVGYYKDHISTVKTLRGSSSPFLLVVLGAPNSDAGELLPIAKSRLEYAIKLYFRFARPPVVITGGFGDHFNRTQKPHWEYVKRALVAGGIQPDDIIATINSSNTQEDIELLSNNAAIHRYQYILIVTSDFHVPRVCLLASNYLGRFSVFGAPTRDHEIDRMLEMEYEKIRDIMRKEE